MPVVANYPDYLLSVFNSSPDNYLLLLPDAPRFTIVAVTDCYNASTNTKREELVGLGVFEAFTDNPANIEATGVENLSTSLRYVLKNKKPHKLPSQRYDVYSANKSSFEVKIWDAEIHPVLDENGEVQYIIHSIKDITEIVKLEQAEKEAREDAENQRKRLINLFSQAPVAIAMFEGPDFKVNLVNKKALEYWGKTLDEVVNKPLFAVLPTARQEYEQILSDVYKTGERFAAKELPLELMRNGKLENILIDLVYEPYYNSNHFVEGIMAVANEVTDQVKSREKIENWAKELEIKVQQRTKKLASYNLKLKQINKELEQFAYIASHDLQEPLRKISTFTQLLESSLGAASGKSKIYLDKIHSSSGRMLKLIRDVLTFSQLSHQRQKLSVVDLNKVMENINSDFELLIKQKDATIEYYNLPEIEAIPMQMNQLFTNLLSNSLKFSRENVKPVVTITASRVSQEEISEYTMLNPEVSYYIIQVTDNGIGFEQKNAEKIFNIFQRLHNKTEYAGTGIGLALCKKIVLNHHGDIYATSTPQKGSVFNIILPEKQII